MKFSQLKIGWLGGTVVLSGLFFVLGGLSLDLKMQSTPAPSESAAYAPGQGSSAGAPRVSVPDTYVTELDQCRGELALMERMLKQWQVEVDGVQTPWPADLEPHLTEVGFKRVVEEVVWQCAPELRVVGFDCDEPPCFAKIRVPHGESGAMSQIVQCPAWQQSYGVTASTAMGTIQCDLGQERFLFIGPPPSQVLPASDDQEVIDNRSKRFRRRIEQAQYSWPCHP